MTRFFLLVCFIFFASILTAQTVVIPAYTGYAIPAEKENIQLFSAKHGLQNWIDPQQKSVGFFM